MLPERVGIGLQRRFADVVRHHTRKRYHASHGGHVDEATPGFSQKRQKRFGDHDGSI